MTVSAGALSTEVSADIGDFQRSMDTAARAVESMTARMNTAASGLERFGVATGISDKIGPLNLGLEKMSEAFNTLGTVSSGPLLVRLGALAGGVGLLVTAVTQLPTIVNTARDAWKGMAEALGLAERQIQTSNTGAEMAAGVIDRYAAAVRRAAGAVDDWRIAEARKLEADTGKTLETITIENIGRRARIDQLQREIDQLSQSGAAADRRLAASLRAGGSTPEPDINQILAQQADRRAAEIAKRTTEQARLRGEIESLEPQRRAAQELYTRLINNRDNMNQVFGAIRQPDTPAAGSAAAPADELTEQLQRVLTALDQVDPAMQTYGERLGVLIKGLQEGRLTQDEFNAAAERAKSIMDEALNRPLLETVNALDPARAAMERYWQEIDNLNAALSRGVISQAYYSDLTTAAMQRLNESLDQTETTMGRVQNLGKGAGTVFSGVFNEMVAGSGKATDAIKRLEIGIANLIMRIFVFKPMENALSSFLGNINFGQIFGNLFGPGMNYAPAGTLGHTSVDSLYASMPSLPARAGGGPVSAGQAYMVGELGTEIFVPDVSGQIIPNHAIGGQGGGITFAIDARGADAGVEARLDALLARRAPALIAAAKSSLAAEVNRGGATSRLFGRRS